VSLRNNPQRTTNILVQVNYGRRRCFHAQTNHISADGMFLATRTLSLPINSNINLQFSIDNNSYEISAIVTGDCSDGIYVGFHKLQPDADNSFRSQIHLPNTSPTSTPSKVQ